jgi:hypothetical protein
LAVLTEVPRTMVLLLLPVRMGGAEFLCRVEEGDVPGIAARRGYTLVLPGGEVAVVAVVVVVVVILEMMGQ